MRIDGKESVLRTVAGDPTSWLAGAPGTGTSPPLSAVDPLSRTFDLRRLPDIMGIYFVDRRNALRHPSVTVSSVALPPSSRMRPLCPAFARFLHYSSTSTPSP